MSEVTPFPQPPRDMTPQAVPERTPELSGNLVVNVGGYGTAGLILHIAATLVTLGAWAPVLVTYLVLQRRRTLVLHVANGVVVKVS